MSNGFIAVVASYLADVSAINLKGYGVKKKKKKEGCVYSFLSLFAPKTNNRNKWLFVVSKQF